MVLDKLCCSLDNNLECLSVEVSISHTKSIIISCLYRHPNGDIETTICVMNKQSNVFMCCHFSMNLLNFHKHKGSVYIGVCICMYVYCMHLYVCVNVCTDICVSAH